MTVYERRLLLYGRGNLQTYRVEFISIAAIESYLNDSVSVADTVHDTAKVLLNVLPIWSMNSFTVIAVALH